MVSTRTLAVALVTAVTVSAHGFVKEIICDGVAYGGWIVNDYPYKQGQVPDTAAWPEYQKDLGFISPSEYQNESGDIVCHRDATNAPAHLTVKAGAKCFLSWDRWPKGHLGPILDYLAPCGDANCEDVEKTSLEFFKFSEAGLKDGTSEWWTDTLLNNMGWVVQIPEDIKPGNYIYRHELIALHSAHNDDGAQNYPQCFNIRIEGNGSKQPEGTLAKDLYTATDPGISLSIYSPNFNSYEIPGPEIAIGGMVSEQSAIQASTTASPTLPGTDVAATSPASQSPELGNNDGKTGASTTISASAPPVSSTTPAAVEQKPSTEASAAPVASSTTYTGPAVIPTKPPSCNKKRSIHARRHGHKHA